jgi:hypothetical protein
MTPEWEHIIENMTPVQALYQIVSVIKEYMKYLILITLSLLSLHIAATENNALVGEWEQYDTGSEHKYTYFKLNNDLSGVFATSRTSDSNNIDYFTPKNATLKDGVLQVTFDDDLNNQAKLILSGYKLEANNTGLATGMLYFYSKSDGNLKLYNTIFIRLIRIKDKPFNDLVSELHKTLTMRSSGTREKASRAP